MRVSGLSSPSTIEKAPQRTRVEVEPKLTPASRGDLRDAIARAHQTVTGKPATRELLDTLTAQASLETGSGAKMYNYNFGGIKGTSPTGETAVCRTKEVIDGKEIEIRDGFRAYRNIDDGAADYVRLMRGRFGAAVSQAEAGNIDGFAHALKKAHYYTADETKYAAALKNLSGVQDTGSVHHVASSAAVGGYADVKSALASAGSLGGGTGSDAFPDTSQLGRVLDAIARHPTMVDDDAEDEG